jgi:thioredoxin reductase (NADPH)
MNEADVTSAQILVSELRLRARVGVNPNEQGADQPIVVDLWVGLEDVARSLKSERLKHTVDYVGVTETTRRVVAERHYPLVENLAAAIANAVLERPRATWVRVRVRKLDCLPSAAAAGVELEMRRPVAEPVPLEPEEIDGEEEVVIVGGGAAGLAAALWCRRLGHPALVVDSGHALGGQLHMVHGQMIDLPAMEPMNGLELARRLWRQFVEHRGRWLRARLVHIESSRQGPCVLELALEPDGTRELRAQTVVLATGVRRRQLEVPGERELYGRGILATGAKGTGYLAGQPVVVVGGGDSACENALLLVRSGARVTLVHRGDALTARQQFRRLVAAEPRVAVRLSTEVLRFVGAQQLEGVELDGPAGRETLAARAALVRVGWIPNSEGLPAGWLDERGFVRTDGAGQVTGETRVFVAGDLQGGRAPSVATSFGSGAAAARAAAQLLDTDTDTPPRSSETGSQR